LLRTALDLKNVSLQSPRQMELILERLSSENMSWRLSLPELEGMRRTLDAAANRLSFSIVVGALIMGAATMAAQAQNSELMRISDGLFIAASVIGLWLVISIMRSGQLK
ncbi:MAG TPA: AarF/ABC1/UbiB kinase family protein, partial [Stenomitos sp.]